MNNIKIYKYYKHPKTCTYPNSCIEQLLSRPQLCCSKLYYSMGLEEVNNKYKQALDEIEEFCTVYSANHDAYETIYKDILDIINKV